MTEIEYLDSNTAKQLVNKIRQSTQKKNLSSPLITLETFGNDSSLLYQSASSLPTEELIAEATITNKIVAIIDSDNEENGDVYQATVTVNSKDDTKNDIAWTKIGNNKTIEGTLSILANTVPTNPITADDIRTLFNS